MTILPLGLQSWERTIRAAELVKNRLLRASAALENATLDGPDAKAQDAVHVIFAGERVRPDYALPAPDVIESEPTETFRVLRLDALVRMKLTSFRDKDRTHLRDMISVGINENPLSGSVS